jgi:hypothetical protein
MSRFFLGLVLSAAALSAVVSVSAPSASAAPLEEKKPQLVRWTAAEDADASIPHVLSVLSSQLKRPLTLEDFIVAEDRDLAFNHYKRLVQVVDGIPVRGRSLRIWTELGSDRTVQVEALLEPALQITALRQGLLGDSGIFGEGATSPQELRLAFTSERTTALVRKTLAAAAKKRGTPGSDDTFIRSLTWNDEFQDGELFRFIRVKGKRGTHHFAFNLRTRRITSREYREFPQQDGLSKDGPLAEITLPVDVFPIYEETDDLRPQGRVRATLKHILPRVPDIAAVANGDIYASLRSQRYLEDKLDPTLGATEAGRAQGYWSPAYIKAQAERIRDSLPLTDNTFAKGLMLQGRYATINIHPDAFEKFGLPGPVGFQKQVSAAYFPNWIDSLVDGKTVSEYVPMGSIAGKPLRSAYESLQRPATRTPEHDATVYMSDGFDELQVYYAIDTLFEELHSRGFRDPELATRPFNAFLYNPDIAYRDNAFYTDDTINFTTYSGKTQNMARDNSTIWHELGHGIMDRLMGDAIELADTGGLSEGMADFVAQIIVQAVTGGAQFEGLESFRILNNTGFYLTNEVHDDGEAYGGTMNDFMSAAIARDGRIGLDKVTDVVLEAMRLTRDYPGLTAPDWFNHILFADSLGRPGLRQPGELKELLLKALAGRNFRLDGGAPAALALVNVGTAGAPGQEVVAGTPGSRQQPITVNLKKEELQSFQLTAQLTNSDSFAFRFPVRVEVEFHKGALQGAIHWVGEEKGPQTYTLNTPEELANIPLTITGTCDSVNRADGSCVDYAYVQVWNNGDTGRPTAGTQARPIAKKRFYLRVVNPVAPGTPAAPRT